MPQGTRSSAVAEKPRDVPYYLDISFTLKTYKDTYRELT